MAPRIGSEHVVMPVHRAEICVDVPALTNKFHAGDIILLVPILQRRIEGNGLPINRLDARHFEVLWIVHPHAKFNIHMEL